MRHTFGVALTRWDRWHAFDSICRKYALPPAELIFMQFQLHQHCGVKWLLAEQLVVWLKKTPAGRVLDAREPWERKWGQLPRSEPLTHELLSEAISGWARDTPIALYCHYGIRSMDAARVFEQEGFSKVYALEGGVEAWSLRVDPTFARYCGEPCA